MRGSLGIGLSTGRNSGRGKVTNIWISSDPTKVGPTLEGGVVVVVTFIYMFKLAILKYLLCILKFKATLSKNDIIFKKKL